MSVFDLIIVVILIALAFRGWLSGMVAQIVSVGSLLVSWIVASRLAFLIAPSIPAEEPWNNIGAMIVLFAVTLVGIRLFHRLLEKKIKDWHLVKLNHQLGAALGFVEGLLICIVITFFSVMLSEATRGVVLNSKTGNYLIRLIQKTHTFIPADSCELLEKQYVLFEEKLGGTEFAARVSDSTSPEEMSLQKMLGSLPNAQQLKEKGEASINELNVLLEKAQGIKQKSSEASSLLDAIGRWWSGNKTEDDEKKLNSAVNDISEKVQQQISPVLKNAVSETVSPAKTTAPTSTVPFTPLLSPTVAAQTAPSLQDAVQSSLSPKTGPPITTLVETNGTIASFSSARSDDALFRRQQSSEVNPPIATAAELEPLRLSVTDSEPAEIAATPMSIPRSFRLSKRLSTNSIVNSSSQLLDSPPTPIPATLFRIVKSE